MRKFLYMLCLVSAPALADYKCIVFTDAAQFSERMQKNEQKTLEELFASRKNIEANAKDAENYYHIGDSTLLVFRNRAYAYAFIKNNISTEVEKLNYGIACGVITYSANEVFGNPVNLASKLGEDEAQNGEVLSDYGNITYRFRH